MSQRMSTRKSPVLSLQSVTSGKDPAVQTRDSEKVKEPTNSDYLPKNVGTSKRELLKRPAPTLQQPSDSSSTSAMLSLEEIKQEVNSKADIKEQANSYTDDSSPEKADRPHKPVFVPKYEPIQTRKRAKISQDAAPFPEPSESDQITKKPPYRKPARSRLTRDEVLTPDVGPRPRAVPKSLLILEPELLPCHIKKKRAQMAKVQIHTSATMGRGMTVLWPSTSQSEDSVTDITKSPGASSLPVEESSVLLEADGGDGSSDGKQEVRISAGEDGTAPYILTTMQGDEASGNFITVSDGHISTVEPTSEPDQGQAIIRTVFSEVSQSLNEERSDTPTSLLLLAEAADPSTAGSQTPCIITSVSDSPVKTFQCSTTGTGTGESPQRKSGPPHGKSVMSPTFMTVSCQGGSATIVASSSDVPTTSRTSTTNLSPNLWTCTVCGELINETDREQHLTQHLDAEEEEDFICETCGEQLKDEEDLELHMAVEHDEEEDEHDGMDLDEDEDENNEEEADATDTNTAGSSRTVLSTTTGTPIYTCDQCGETFPYAAYLRQHVKSVHTDTGAVFTCTMCPRSFTSESALEMHSCLHQKPGISFKCIRCSQSFSSAALLSSHARTCLRVAIHSPSAAPKRGRGRGRGSGLSRGASHACSLCQKTFTSEVYLKAHQLSHETGVDTGNNLKRNHGLQCLYCPEKFHHLGPLKEHMLAKHPKAFPFKCTICQRGFSRDSSRIAHEQTHQTLKLFVCSICGEGFTLQAYLNRHMKYRHLKPVKFHCRVCQKECVRQADLIKHERVHTGEKPYVCEQCGHGFSQQSNYRYHMMRHRGEKPHMCPMCNKGFRVPSHLKLHMQQHLNERFTCQHCDKVFSQSRYLNRHMRTHAKIRQLKGSERILPAPVSASNPDATETVVVYENTSASPVKTDQQVIVDSVGDVSEHLVVQDSAGEAESVIQFIVDNKDGGEAETKELAVVDAEGNAIMTTTVGATSNTFTNMVRISTGESSDVGEEQTQVNADEGTRVVVGAFSEGEGGNMEDGNVTLPFKDLMQLLGGKHYNCDVCSESFSIRPNSIYNMVHTNQSHILVINLNDHHRQPHTDS